MAAAMIPALGRDFADSPLFRFASDLVRTHAAVAFRERPIDPPEQVGPSFGDLSRTEQLETAETVCRQLTYQDALGEALPESDGYDRWLTLAIDANVDDAEIGRRARELILTYLARVAALRGDEFAELI